MTDSTNSPGATGEPNDDAWVRDLLSGLAEPSMPADISIRIQQAIAAEQGITLGDELAARRARMQRWRGKPMWAAGAAAAAAVVAAVVIPSVVDTDKRDSNTLASTEAAQLPAPAAADAGSAKRAAGVPGTISGSQFSASSLPEDVKRLLASVGTPSMALSAPADQSADAFAQNQGTATTGGSGQVDPAAPTNGGEQQTEPTPPDAATQPGAVPGSGSASGSGGGSGGSSGSTGSGGTADDSGGNASSEVATGPASSGFTSGDDASSASQAPLDESCLATLGSSNGGGSVIATDFGYWQSEPAYLVVVDDPRYPDTYTAIVVSPDCTSRDLHQLYTEKVPRQ